MMHVLVRPAWHYNHDNSRFKVIKTAQCAFLALLLILRFLRRGAGGVCVQVTVSLKFVLAQGLSWTRLSNCIDL